MDDRYNLQRFVSAQDAGDVYQDALGELRRGRKTSHWIWFVFPQIAGLGQSSMSRQYAISGLEEAAAYLAHPVLGPRLRECTQAMLDTGAASAEQVLGGIDAVKLRSSMTLFMRAAPEEPVFSRVLEQYFGGRPDPETDQRI